VSLSFSKALNQLFIHICLLYTKRNKQKKVDNYKLLDAKSLVYPFGTDFNDLSLSRAPFMQNLFFATNGIIRN